MGNIFRAGEELLDMENYWLSQLRGCESIPIFPALPDKSYQPQTKVQIDHGSAINPRLRLGVSFSAVVRVVWSLLISRITNSNMVVFGAAVSDHAYQQPVFGWKGSSRWRIVPMCIHVDELQSVEDAIRDAELQETDMIPFGHVSVEEIRSFSNDTFAACQFQTLVVVEPYDLLNPGRAEQGLNNSKDAPIETVISNAYVLVLNMVLCEEGFTMKVSFDPAVVDNLRVQRLIGQFEATLGQLWEPQVTPLPLTLRDISSISRRDLEDIWHWNSLVPETEEKFVHDLISIQARREPNSPAICAWDGEASYGELDDMSSRLAHRLKELGIGAKMLVPICFEKSMWMSVAMLGVMKAGAAFVAMDASQPEQRLRVVVQQIGAKLILTSAAQEELASGLGVCPTVVSKNSIQGLSTEPSRKMQDGKMSTADTLYAVFTSGTTGTPKGVLITHANFSSAVKHQASALGFSSRSRVFDFASYSFDVAINNALMTLSVGGCLCVPSDDDRRDDIEGAIARLKANYMELTPSVACLINPSDALSIEMVNLSGEKVNPSDTVHWIPKARVLNTYGPSECTVTCVANTAIVSPLDTVSLGKGIGAVTWIVSASDHQVLVPIGAIGELLIEGPLVGSGYLGNVKKTESVFISDPPWLLNGIKGHRPGRQGRLYKTGDLVRYRPDGSLEYVGRIDTQVKLHGQRLELGEVEYHLRQHLPKAVDIIAEVVEIESNCQLNQMLVAFICLKDTATLASMTSEIKGKLHACLPYYMVPSAYVPIATVPITLSGKTDRRQLKELASSLSREQLFDVGGLADGNRENGRNVALSTLTERKLQKLWAQILAVDVQSLGLEVNFFQQGGDSIAAMRLVSAARKEGVQLTVAAIFRNPRFVDMAKEAKPCAVPDFQPISPLSLLGPRNAQESIRREVAVSCGVDAALIEDTYPCTPLQEGLMAMTAKQPDAYIGRDVVEIPKYINLERFQAAWTIVIARNAILRTRIVQTTCRLVQVVIEENVKWAISKSLPEYLAEDRRTSMHLGDPLARWALIVNSEEQSRQFVWTIHHALYDGWTMPIINRQVYLAYCGDELGPEIQFSNFIHYLETQDWEEVSAYWRSQLDGAEGSSTFPALPSKAYQPSPKRTLDRLLVTPQTLRTTVTMPSIIRAAWAILMARLSGNDDVVFGATLIGRNAPGVPGIDEMTGPTITTVPVRIRLRRDQDTATFLLNTQLEVSGMMAAESFGLQRIRKISADTEAACQFQTLLVIQPPIDLNIAPFKHGSDEEVIGGFFNSFDVSDQLSDFNVYALMLVFTPGRNILVQANYDDAVIDSARVSRLLDQFEHIVDQLCRLDLDMPSTLKDISCMSRKELQDIWRWNSSVPESVDQCMHDLISTRAHQQPKSPAVCAWDGELTYEQLDSLSSQLAMHLVKLGVAQGVKIPLCFEKSMWTSVAMIAVMKAGGAFVALDPSQPKGRLHTIIQQTEAELILTSPAKFKLASTLLSKAVVVGSSLLKKLSSAQQKPLEIKVNPSDTLFVVFTSGSTGVPKGILITHSNFSSAVRYHERPLSFNAKSRVFDFASYSFDIAMHNALTTFVVGGCLCIPHEDERMHNIEGAMERLKVNLADFTPSIARLINPAAVPTLKTLLLAGEAVDEGNVLRWSSKVSLINAYGPAECQICTAFPIIQAKDATNIGRGVGTVTWVANPDESSLVPIGAPGELLIEGPLVSVGYINTAAASARFIHDPHWLLKGAEGQPGRHGRLYKTGDMVRYNSDGTLKYLGRIDEQVKLRGQRVELGEVEFHLMQHMPALEIAAEVVQILNGDSILIAFISLSDADKLASLVTGLDLKLAEHLPSYMIPSAYVPLDKMPMTASGKLDRKQLKKIGEQIPREKMIYYGEVENPKKREPSTLMECKLQVLWAKVLNLEDIAVIGADDNFFRHGGDSIAAMRLVSIARAEGISLTVPAIFHNPRLTDMAREGSEAVFGVQTIAPFSLLGPQTAKQAAQTHVAATCGVDVSLIEDIYACTPLQEGLIALSTKDSSAYVSRDVVELPQSTDMKRFQEAWESVVRHNPILRTRIVHLRAHELVQVVINEDVKWMTSNSLSNYLAEDSRALTQMSLGSKLSQFAIINPAGQSTRYFVRTMHHAIYDAFTLSLITRQALQIYLQEKFEHNVGFNSFIQYSQSQTPEESQAYWHSQLIGAKASSVFPIPTTPSYQLSQSSKSQIDRYLKGLPRLRTEITASSILRAAWAILVARTMDSDDVVFGATLAGRNASTPMVEKIAGPTITTVPVRLKVDDSQQLSHFLEGVYEHAVGMMPFEHTGLQNIQKMSEDAKAACQFQTLLVIQPSMSMQIHKSANKEVESLFPVPDASGDLADFNTYALMVVLSQAGENILMQFSFDSAVLDPRRVEILMAQFERVLRQLYEVTNLPRTIGEISCMSEQELRAIWQWNAVVPESVESCVHDLFTERVFRQPSAWAVYAWDGQMTYSDLDQRSSQVAVHLVELGVGSEVIVPICFEKSVWMPVAVLGVVKTGAAFVAMDPAQPHERLHVIMQQTRAKIALVSRATRELVQGIAAKTIVIDAINLKTFNDDIRPAYDSAEALPSPTINGQNREYNHVKIPLSNTTNGNMNSNHHKCDSIEVAPSAALYVIFTSGSTGIPKCVKVTHANLASAAKHQAPLLGFDTDARVFDFSSYSFDAYILNMFYTILSGGCLCIPSDTDRIERISGALNDMNVNLALLTPSVARLLDPSQLQNLKGLLLGGEALGYSDVAMWMPHVKLSNLYGPSECTIVSTVNKSLKSPRDAVNIGHGAGTVTWIASSKDHNRLAPIGTIGELLIEGPLVCAGYHGDEARTAAAFISDPTWLLDGIDAQSGRHGKLYKTGDLVRYNSDGSLEYMGRADTQVKLRGQRIELGEIEHHLKQQLHPEALEVFAEVIDPEDGSPVLIALVLLSNASAHLRSMASRVTDKLRNLLPDYMIPSAYVPIQSVPMTASGKTDRKQLRYYGSSLFRNHMVTSRPEGQVTRKPTAKLELQISRLWARALTLDEDSIDANDNFFSLGGDSIAAMRLIAMAREEGVSLTMESIFCNPQLSEMAGKGVIESVRDVTLIPTFSLLGLSTSIQMETVRAEVAAHCQVEVGIVEDVYPCTPLQEGLLALTAKQAAAYISRDIIKLPKNVVDIERYRRAWEAVIARNAILRTRIVQTKLNGLVQVVIKKEAAKAAEWARSTSLSNYLAENPTSQETVGGKLCRWAIVTPPGVNGINYFVWTVHHALYDGWTISIITDQVSRIYRGEEVLNTESPFNAFIHHLCAHDLGKDRDYWKSQLNGAAEGSSIFPLLPSQSYQPLAKVGIDFSLDLNTAPSNTKISKTALIWGAWAILMANLAESSDVVFGATLAGRDVAVPGISDIVGPTITTVPVRIQVDAGQESVDFLANIKQQMEEMIPFEHFGLQNIRRINSDTQTACQFQTLLLIQPHVESDGAGKDLFNCRDIDSDLINFSTYALTLVFSMGISDVSVKATYDDTLMDQPEVERLVQRLEKVLQYLCRHPHQKIGAIDCLSDEELQTIWEWNAEIPESVERCVHDSFAVRAQKQPSSSAITAWDGEMTYQELDEFSSRLAMHLVGELGVGPGVRVPICFEKTMWMPVAMLGVLKAGGAFVAMDVSQPEQRLRSIVAQSSAKIILTSEKHLDLIRRLEAQVVIINRSNLVTMKAFHNLTGRAKPSSILCVVFTSGSTGTPKGVKLTHANFSSAAKHHAVEFGFKTSTRMFDFASYSFDVSINNILLTLLVGGCVCVPHDEERINDVEGAMKRLKVNLVNITPAVARLINPSAIPSLDLLLLGGDKLNASDVTQWISKVPRLINLYGPTECTVSCLANLSITKPSDAASIGKGIGAVTWITSVDDHNSLAPIGAIGELLIEGPLVSSGYLEDFSTTAFVSNPPWLLKGCNGKSGRQGRLYKTGDLVRYNSEGSLLFIGRKDRQVKLRGQRVELSEIEHHLRLNLKNIVEVVVEMVWTKNGSHTLLAFVSAKATPLAAMVGGLNDKLCESLPSYMIPSAYVPVEKMPMTVSGKIDRKQLQGLGSSLSPEQMIDPSGQSDIHEKIEPVTNTERLLQSLWAQVLAIEKSAIGANDNFFKLGGDSVAAMRLVGAARDQAQGIILTVAAVFRNAQLSDMAREGEAAAIAQAANRLSEESKVIAPFTLLRPQAEKEAVRAEVATRCGIDAVLVEDVYPCTPMQEGLIALTAKQPEAYIARNIVELSPDVDVERFKTAWDVVVTRNPSLRTRVVQTEQHGLVQVVTKTNAEWVTSENLPAYLKQDKQKTMSLGDRLATWAIARVQGNKHHFIWTIHHALYDGWSMSIIINQVHRAYHGQDLEHETSFKAFIQYLTTQGLELEQCQNYWKSQLRGAESSSVFPSLPSRTYQPEPKALLDRISFPAPTLHSTVTVQSTIRAAWSALIARLTGNDHIIFGVTMTGRNAPIPGIERMTGPTITTIPVQVCVDSSEQARDFLASIQVQTVDAMQFEHVGLQYISRINADTHAACQFQTLLIIQPQANSDATEVEYLLGDQDISSTLADFSTYALTLVFSTGVKDISIQASYDSAVVDELQLKYILGQLKKVIEQLGTTDGLQQRVGDIDCMSNEELDAIWNRNAVVPVSIEQCVHDMIASKAQQMPGKPAICAWDGELTYQELDRLSSRLSLQLVELGVGPEIKVPLCFEKSKWMTVAMLGVMKAGGAFVALDPTQPEGRLHALMEQIQSELILTSSAQLNLASSIAASPLVVSEANSREARGEEPVLIKKPNPSGTLYVVFTSGSTGIPKGVVISHANLCSAATHQAATLGFNADSRSFDFSSYSFDAYVFNTIYTLLNGGCLCVPSEVDRKERVSETMNAFGVNIAQLTPSISRLLDPRKLPTLKVLILTGEILNPSDVSQWIGYVQVINAYGPTECTIMCAANTRIERPRDSSSVGCGLGSVIWISDPTDPTRLAPVGAAGELLVEGPIIGQGYLNDPEMTAAALIHNPPWLLRGSDSCRGRPGTLFRTGDMGRYNHDGSITYMARKDTEVKLRGQRVELGELEHHLRQHLPYPIQTVAEVIKPENGGPKLVAFVCLADVSELASIIIGLGDKLGESLPDYMIPSAYIPIDSLPMTASGKADRRRLRELGSSITRERMLDANGLSGPQEKREPSTWMERKLQGLWARMLDVEPTAIGADDDFFREGGDSIVVMRLVGVAREEGLSMTVRDVFRYPKLSKLALFCSPIENGSVRGNAQDPFEMLDCEDVDTFIRNDIEPRTKLKRSDITDIFPVTGFQADCMNNRFQPLALQYAYLDLGPDVDVQQLFQACKSILYSFETFRTVFVEYRDSFLQVVLRDPPLQTLICQSEDDVRSFSTAYCLKDQAETMFLGQLFTRFILVIGPNRQRRMIVKFSHAQYDGFCVHQIFSAIQTAYEGNQIPFNLPFSSFVHHRLQTKQRAYDYWRNALRDSKITPEPRFESGSGIRILKSRLVINGYLQKSVRPAVLVSVAWALVLAELFEEKEVVYGHVVAGRSTDLVGIESIVGPCINIIPVKVKLQTGRKIMEVFDSMAAQLVSSGPFEGLDWNDLVDNCTNWPRGTQFGSVVHHRNIDFKPQIGLEGEQIQLDWFESHNRPAWTGVTAHAEGSDLRIHFFANPVSMNDKAADMLLDKLISNIQGFMTSLQLP